MRRWHLLIALAIALLAGAGAGSYRGASYGGTSFGRGAGSYHVGGVSAVDTFRVISRVTAFPNSMAKAACNIYQDSTRATVNSSNSGAAVRYGYISNNSGAGDLNTLVGLPANLQFKLFSKGPVSGSSASHQSEDDFNWNSGSQTLAFIWVSANGLTNGDRIERAFLMWNAPLDGTNTATLNTSITVRLDTISADYRAIDGVSVGRETGYTDPNWLDMSWNYADIGNAELWSPTMNERHDWHDFGPRADQLHPAGYGQYAPADRVAGTLFRFDVTDAVQQASDNGTLGRGLLFVVTGYGGAYPNGASDITIAAGNHSIVGSAGKGCPVFTAVASSRRGPKVWNGARVPIVLTFDDNKSDHTLYMPIVRAAGLRFTTMSQTEAFTANSARYDSLMSANAGYVDIVHHTKTHVSTGTLTGALLNAELELAGHYAPSLWTWEPDTSAIVGFAYPGDSARPKYSFEALSKAIAYGYTASRAIGLEAAASAIGVVAAPAWDRPTNMQAMAVWYPDSLMGTPGSGPPPTPLATQAAVREQLYDTIDRFYNDDRAAAIVYIHNRAIDGVTAQVLQWLVDEINASNCAELVNYYDMVNMRIAGAEWMDPATITNTYATNNYFSTVYAAYTQAPANFTGAAKYDSVRTAVGTPQVMKDNMLRVWIAPK